MVRCDGTVYRRLWLADLEPEGLLDLQKVLVDFVDMRRYPFCELVGRPAVSSELSIHGAWLNWSARGGGNSMGSHWSLQLNPRRREAWTKTRDRHLIPLSLRRRFSCDHIAKLLGVTSPRFAR